MKKKKNLSICIWGYLNSQKRLTYNFFLGYPYIAMQTGSKYTQTNQVEVVILIWQQILVTHIQENV